MAISLRCKFGTQRLLDLSSQWQKFQCVRKMCNGSTLVRDLPIPDFIAPHAENHKHKKQQAIGLCSTNIDQSGATQVRRPGAPISA